MRKWLMLICAALLVLCSCFAFKSKPERTYGFNDTFDTYIQIRAFDVSEKDFEEMCRRTRSLFLQLDILFDPEGSGAPGSLSALNRSGGGALALPVRQLLLECLLFEEETKGAFSPTLEPLSRIWRAYLQRYAGGEGPLPPAGEIQEALAKSSLAPLFTDDGRILLQEGAGLDLSAAAKGFAAELAARSLSEAGYRNFVIDAGGNLRFSDCFWQANRVHFSIPAKQAAFLITGKGSMAAATSGGTSRYYLCGGQVLHHLTDPATGWPAEKWQSVSVVCYDAALADRLSTALFCMDKEAGALLCEKYGAAALWTASDGTLYCNRQMARLCPAAASLARVLTC